MQNDNLATLQTIWNSIVKTDEQSEYNADHNFDHLLNLFKIGDFYYYIFNLQTSQLEFISPGIESITGISVDDFNPQQFLKMIHPADYTHYLNSEATAIQFAMNFEAEKLVKYKIRTDFRLINSKGETLRILQHLHPLQISKAGGIIRCLGIHTDISYLNVMGRSILSFIGMDGEPNFIDLEIIEKFKPTKEILTSREKELLRYLFKGQSSKQIAYHLSLSEATVNTHRRNILAKTSCNSIQEVIYKAIENGWI